MVKRKGVSETLTFCTTGDTMRYGYRADRIDKPRLRNFAKQVKEFLFRTDIQTRTEGSSFSLYCKDSAIYHEIVAKLSGYIVEVFEPSSTQELDYMLNNSHKKVLRNQLPYDEYRYRVYFKPDCDSNTKQSFANWIINYSGKVRVPVGTVKWCLSGWRQGPFIYVKDQSTLAMVGLFMGHNVHKVEEFILRSSINTNLDQDIVCQHLASD